MRLVCAVWSVLVLQYGQYSMAEQYNYVAVTGRKLNISVGGVIEIQTAITKDCQ